MSLYADDLEIGQTFGFGRYTLSEAEILSYAQRWDPIFIHVDPEAATRAGLGGVIASGLHLLAIYQRFVVEVIWSRAAGGVGRTMDTSFRRPVRPGTTVSGRATVHSVEPRPQRGDAVVTIHGELLDEENAVVLSVVNTSVLPLRADADDVLPAERR